MPDLLIELFSEEIPARMQGRAAEDLRKAVTDGLVEAGLVYEGAKAFATPRRLALNVVGVPVESPASREERKGPRVGALEQAVAGFLKSAGLSSVEEARIESDPKKGEFYVAVVEKPGRPTTEIVAEIVPDIIRRFPWPKSMRWGSGSLRWVRPLKSILCVFGPETEETEVVDLEVDGIRSGRTTRGHRFMAPAEISVRRFDDYVARLETAKVVLDAGRRRDIIRNDARNLAFAQGFELVEDEGLIEEVAGLVEWPVVLMGAFDEAFLDIPPEVVRLTIRNNQKCFVLRRSPSFETRPSAAPQDEAVLDASRSGALEIAPHPEETRSAVSKEEGPGLAPRFLLVANIETADGGEKIVAGNERVIAARLSDARFFWDQDRKALLKEHARKLGDITFHEKLGTQGQRVERIARLARELAPVVGADSDKAEEAARLAKADLVTGMVGEFPELQGVMGRYYALAEGLDPEVAEAIRDHYRPVGQGDEAPNAPVSVAVALADKLDMLVGFWAIDEKPTGSKDPYALRRAALGVIRIVLENGLRVSLRNAFYERWSIEIEREAQAMRDRLIAGFLESHEMAREHLAELDGLKGGTDDYIHLYELMERIEKAERLPEVSAELARKLADAHVSRATQVEWQASVNVSDDLLVFFADRLKVQLRDDGARHDLVDAVFALEGQDDLLMIVRRVQALGAFLDTEDGASLLTAYRRAANILRIEEKKDDASYDAEPDASAFAQNEERALHDAIREVTASADAALAKEDFAAAMAALAGLRAPVDAFFDTVTVNADDRSLRANRLKLLSRIRAAMDRVADFSKIGG